MRFVGTALELGMELYAYKEVVVRYFNGFHYSAVGGYAAQCQSRIAQNVSVIVIELVAVTVSLAYAFLTVASANYAALDKIARIRAEAERAALAYAA